MPIELCILGSGSSGNCSVLRTPSGAMLIDAGLGPRTVSKRLAGTGLALQDIGAICLTHLDSDHFNANWLATIVRQSLRIYCHSQRLNDLLHIATTGDPRHEHRDALRALVKPFGRSAFEPLAELRFHAIPLAHDRAGSHGFLIEGFDRRVGYATDLGRVPDELIARFADGLDVLAIESNYDPRMQLDSARPWFLKQRIMGGSGHLSNQQAFEAVRRILDRCRQSNRPIPEHIVLLHRSRQCNCPRLLRHLFSQDARIADRLTIAEQSQRSEWLRASSIPPAQGEQLTLGFSAAG